MDIKELKLPVFDASIFERKFWEKGHQLRLLIIVFLILKGVLDNAGFLIVTAHFLIVYGQQQSRTTILVKFVEEVSPIFY
ncbi:hypothetical protein ACS0TY_026844 [Phlomoides rotata]